MQLDEFITKLQKIKERYGDATVLSINIQTHTWCPTDVSVHEDVNTGITHVYIESVYEKCEEELHNN